jgi:hypothetical protein
LKTAYVDSSCPVAIALDEPGSRFLLVRLSRFDRLFSSNLLEAELMAALAREGSRGRLGGFLSWLRWVCPYERLTREMDQVLDVGRLRGPDLWHLACALFLRSRVEGEVFFLTLDRRQSDVARALGFRILD